MQYEGRVFRPPSEAQSLLIQTTIGCAWNKCTFCDMYAEKKFRIRDLADIKRDLTECARYQDRVRRIFLCDGDALVLSAETLIDILTTIRTLFPGVQSVRAYAAARDILSKTPRQLAEMRALGLDMVYIGLETGSDKLLKSINKGVTRQQMIDASALLVQAGIKQSISIIAGLAGKTGWEEHMRETASALNEMQPEYLGLLVLTNGSDGSAHNIRGNGAPLPSSEQVLREMRLLVENLTLQNCLFTSAHISNYIHIKGSLPQDKEKLLCTIDRLIAAPV